MPNKTPSPANAAESTPSTPDDLRDYARGLGDHGLWSLADQLDGLADAALEYAMKNIAREIAYADSCDTSAGMPGSHNHRSFGLTIGDVRPLFEVLTAFRSPAHE